LGITPNFSFQVLFWYHNFGVTQILVLNFLLLIKNFAPLFLFPSVKITDDEQYQNQDNCSHK
jgi:hypothetical protein